MAAPRFAYSNLIDAAGVVFTASSETSGLPASNLANELRTKVWRTGTSTAAESVVIDLGSARAFAGVILLDHDLVAGDSGITLEANSADSWGAPPFSQALTRVDGPISAWFATQTYRYCRLKFTKASAGVTRQIGRLFIGPYMDLSVGPSSLDIAPVDLSKTSRSRGGQTYADVGGMYDAITLGFDLITTADKDALQTLQAAVGLFRSFFVSIERDTQPVAWLYYVKSKKLATAKAQLSLNNWSADLSLEEQL